LTNDHNNKSPAALPARVSARALGLSLAFAGLLAGCGQQLPSDGMEAGGGRGPVSVIATQVAERQFVDRFTALGTARANESIEVISRMSSVVTGITFEEGHSVAAGELLVELDNREIRAELANAQASLQQKRSQYRRSQGLRETRVVSEADLELLEADVLMAEAQVRAAQARLDDSMIRAPFSGTVGLRRISLGDLVGPDTIITTLDDTDIIKLEFAVPEPFVAAISLGMMIQADSNVYPDLFFRGQVSSIDTRVDPVTRSMTVIAKLPNDERLMKPGMFLTVELERTRDNVVLIPEEALMPRQGRQYVFLIEDGRAVETPVELGIRAPGLAEIRSGVTPGDVIITEGAQKVRNGAPVQIISNT
jgi:membrane fusion protein (multidrug efflux system)